MDLSLAVLTSFQLSNEAILHKLRELILGLSVYEPSDGFVDVRNSKKDKSKFYVRLQALCCTIKEFCDTYIRTYQAFLWRLLRRLFKYRSRITAFCQHLSETS